MNFLRLHPGKRERGAVIVWTAFFLVMLLGFVALGIDVAKLMTTRTQLQNTADAAALAGASAVNPLTGVIDQDTALVRAQFTAGRNKAFVGKPEPVQLLAADVQFPSSDECQVTVRRDPSAGGSMVTHVAQVLGITSLEVKASATAKAERAGSVDCGLVPLGVTPNPGETFQPGCQPGYVLKIGGGAGSNGNYGPLSFPMCLDGPCAGLGPTGANTYRCLLENGYCCTIEQAQVLDTEPGNMSGPTRMAMEARFNSDTDPREGICYSQYLGNGRRVINVPIITDPGVGRTSVTVQGFAAFFIKNRPGSGNQSFIIGEFLYQVAPGTGDGNPNGTLFALRLIK